MSDGDCCNRTPYPFHIPGYQGNVTGHKFHIGNTYAQGTHAMILRNIRGPEMRGMPRPVYPDPCAGHQRDLRAKLHMLQGEIDPNPCKKTEWNTRNKFCIEKPKVMCPPKLKKMNQHGYLSRLSVYQNPDLGVVACKADNTYPCKERAPSQKPFWKEYEDVTNEDLFLEYPEECRHLRFPKLKYKDTCWDKEVTMPLGNYLELCRCGFPKPCIRCECLPLVPRRKDEDIEYYRIDRDPERFMLPYFADPTNKYRYFKSGYTGHCPTLKYRIGDSYAVGTKKALNRFTCNYMTAHLLEKCPVYIDPNMYCDDIDYFKVYCDRRKSYDGHFHEKPIRDRLKPVFDPKNCLPPNTNDPAPLNCLWNC